MSFSILYFSRAWVAQSIASCCMSSDMSAFLITAFLVSSSDCWSERAQRRAPPPRNHVHPFERASTVPVGLRDPPGVFSLSAPLPSLNVGVSFAVLKQSRQAGQDLFSKPLSNQKSRHKAEFWCLSSQKVRGGAGASSPSPAVSLVRPWSQNPERPWRVPDTPRLRKSLRHISNDGVEAQGIEVDRLGRPHHSPLPAPPASSLRDGGNGGGLLFMAPVLGPQKDLEMRSVLPIQLKTRNRWCGSAVRRFGASTQDRWWEDVLESPPQVGVSLSGFSSLRSPGAVGDLSILLLNLPPDAEEEEIKEGMEGGCGKVEKVRMFRPPPEYVSSLSSSASCPSSSSSSSSFSSPSPSSSCASVPRLLLKSEASSDLSGVSALVTFKTAEAKRKALLPACRAFGILCPSAKGPLSSDTEEKKGSGVDKRAAKGEGKAKGTKRKKRESEERDPLDRKGLVLYPQDANNAVSVVVRNVPLSLSVETVVVFLSWMFSLSGPGKVAMSFLSPQSGALSRPCVHSLSCSHQSQTAQDEQDEGERSGKTPVSGVLEMDERLILERLESWGVEPAEDLTGLSASAEGGEKESLLSPPSCFVEMKEWRFQKKEGDEGESKEEVDVLCIPRERRNNFDDWMERRWQAAREQAGGGHSASSPSLSACHSQLSGVSVRDVSSLPVQSHSGVFVLRFPFFGAALEALDRLTVSSQARGLGLDVSFPQERHTVEASTRRTRDIDCLPKIPFKCPFGALMEGGERESVQALVGQAHGEGERLLDRISPHRLHQAKSSLSSASASGSSLRDVRCERGGGSPTVIENGGEAHFPRDSGSFARPVDEYRTHSQGEASPSDSVSDEPFLHANPQFDRPRAPLPLRQRTALRGPPTEYSSITSFPASLVMALDEEEEEEGRRTALNGG
uniref:RRM domain-containing protein n=1 Tax=Chromera velia CCMP2878 TaxID=1169474 RepID=A0A0G4FLC1_9ALVE|eukprot:Cvel_17584.t1-p1 / transcript=Cvel_17584.t1 / gene=Cvel_17584 / organism=Chromera_velia_CCMP2878 / gene_product=Dynein light chain 2, cytoplasmic, putative / transcript_product=Dynein light chain 2, cytoplasmic, putative / location=Cvel_scaffold1413:40314-43632(-) / protein_length=902 / sequence_SO=supercontig / SO=protein_coding / is_pseudo=false